MSSDVPGELRAANPGLRVLLRSLTGAAEPAELAGEEAALAMFRAIRPSAGIPASSVNGDAGHVSGAQRLARRPRHRRARAGHARRAGWVAAVTLALCGGFTVAGYAAVLPAPVQRVAHSLFGFAGVPNTARHPGATPSVSVTPHRPASAPPSTRPGSPGPSASAQAPALSATVASAQVPAGGELTVTALLTSGGRAMPGAALRLLEQAAGQHAWLVAAQAKTSTTGQAALVVPRLTINATFRVTGPDGSASRQLTVVVIPAVSVSVTSSGGHRSLLTAKCPLAQRGDLVELQILSGGQWRDVRGHRIGATGLAAFTVPASKDSMTYRVVLLATAYHGQSVSHSVTVPGRRHPGRGQPAILGTSFDAPLTGFGA